MHILKIIHGYPPEYNAGSEVYSQSICEQLSQKHRVSVFTREENPYAPCYSVRQQQKGEQLQFFFVNNPQGKDGYRHAAMDSAFGDLLDRLQPDIAHIGHVNHLSTGLVHELKKRLIPIVYTLHDFWLMCPRGQFLTRSIGRADNWQTCEGQNHEKCARDCYQVYFSGRAEDEARDVAQWTDWVERRMQETRAISSMVDLFIAPSQYLRQRFIREFGIAEDKIIYLDYGFPLSYLRPLAPTAEKRPFTFGYIGTHIPAKGINLLIEAFKQVQAPAALRIYGRSNGQSSAALRQMAENSPQPITFEGEYINSNLSERVFSQVDCIVVPSIWGENSPLVIHEAQACRIPVITADVGGMSEYVAHNINGLLFRHRDSQSLAEQLKFAAENGEEMQILGKRGYLYDPNGEVPEIAQHCEALEAIYKRFLPAPSVDFWRITLDTNPEDCNLACTMCEEHSPHSDYIRRELGGKHRRMPADWLRPIFEQAKALGLREIIPSTMGEPLLYKHFGEFVELCHEFGLKMNLTTNGTFPRVSGRSAEDWARRIVPISSDIKISFNGATAETAAAVMLGIDFEQTLANIRTLVRLRNEHYQNTGYYCRLTLQLTFLQNNMQELADIVRLAAELDIDRVKGHHLWAHFEEIQTLSFRQNAASIATWNKYVAQAELARLQNPRPNGKPVLLENIIPLQEQETQEVPEDYECPFLGKELWVSPTGRFSPCCAPDAQRQTLGDFGHFPAQSLREVLQSRQYQQLQANYKSIPLCKSCNMRKPVKSEK